jgi:predicted cobalt transporter CbtA
MLEAAAVLQTRQLWVLADLAAVATGTKYLLLHLQLLE